MSQENVIRFDASARKAMARRGSPDKFLAQIVEVDCPHCGVILCLDAEPVAYSPELLCAGCQGVIGPEEFQAADAGS